IEQLQLVVALWVREARYWELRPWIPMHRHEGQVTWRKSRSGLAQLERRRPPFLPLRHR
ncbi:unnamed protein product, partial [Urochloa humidicola]